MTHSEQNLLLCGMLFFKSYLLLPFYLPRCSLCTFRSFGRDDFERHLSTAHPETTAVDHSAENGFRQAADRRSPGSARLYCVYCHSVGEQKVSWIKETAKPTRSELYLQIKYIVLMSISTRLNVA